MPKLTKRGRVVLIYAPAALALLSLLVWISARFGWLGSGIGSGTLPKCFLKGLNLFYPCLTGTGEESPLS